MRESAGLPIRTSRAPGPHGRTVAARAPRNRGRREITGNPGHIVRDLKRAPVHEPTASRCSRHRNRTGSGRGQVEQDGSRWTRKYPADPVVRELKNLVRTRSRIPGEPLSNRSRFRYFESGIPATGHREVRNTRDGVSRSLKDAVRAGSAPIQRDRSGVGAPPQGAPQKAASHSIRGAGEKSACSAGGSIGIWNHQFKKRGAVPQTCESAIDCPLVQDNRPIDASNFIDRGYHVPYLLRGLFNVIRRRV